jgi:hypothetical protein
MLFLLVACSKATPVPDVTATSIPATEPVVTSTPGTPLVILVLPADMPAEESSLYQGTIYDLAQANGMRFQVLNSLTPQDIQLEAGALKVVIALPPDPGLSVLVAAAPSVQFLAVNIPGLPAAPNLSMIGSEGVPVDRQAFMAGYVGAMITEDYRIGILTMKDDNVDLTTDAYFNGMKFYCGMCQKAFGPWYDYPIQVRIPVEETQAHYPGYAIFNDYEASTVYVSPDVATLELLEHMATIGLNIISEDMPAQDLQANWVVSLKPELIPAIQRIFPELLAGNGGQVLPVPLVLDDVNTELLSEGKQRLVQETLDNLQSGLISTGVNP